MELPVTYVWTHDSIGLGEDGPTHQPVEHLWALRAIPGLDVVRPADANETVGRLADHPGAQRPPGRPVPDPAEPAGARPRRAGQRRGHRPGRVRPGRGGRRRAGGDPHRDRQRGADRARGPRAARGRERYPARVVSMPCVEWFTAQDAVLPRAGASAARSGPGSASRPASRWAGGRSSATPARCVSLEHFGASADYQMLLREVRLHRGARWRPPPARAWPEARRLAATRD